MIPGIDVSHFQSPAAVPWKLLGAAGGFAIVRMTYGIARDERAADHVSRARAAGVTVGGYHFFRASQPVAEQLEVFQQACHAADYGKQQDIVPAIDFEDDTTARPITREQAPLAQELCQGLARAFGARPLLYITQRDWGRVGSPEWAFDYPLWIAHYSAASRTTPATPGNRPWAIWQHRVGPFDLHGPHGYYEPATYDHDIAGYLPLLHGGAPKMAPINRPAGQLPPDDHATEVLRAVRLDELARQGVAASHAAGMAEMAEDA